MLTKTGLSAACVLSVIFAAAPARASEIVLKAELGQSVLPAEKSGKVYLRLNLRALAGAGEAQRAPVNVALVLDRSGSMAGERIAAAKEAAAMALARLGRDDILSVVSFASGVDVMQPAAHVSEQTGLRGKIAAMRADGSTALYAGVEEGGREVTKFLEAKRINRVILMSDGQANVGPASPRELAELGRSLGGKGISVSTIGLGLDYNEDLMQRLAAASDGNHAFAQKPKDLVTFFNAEFGDALQVAAQDIKIIIEIKPGFTPRRVLNRDSEINGRKITLDMNHLQRGADRYVVVELEAEGRQAGADAEVADIAVDYLDLDAGARRSARSGLTARFSSDAREAEASLNKDVTAQVTSQVATEQNEKAVELRDKGDVAGAKKLLQDNAAALRAAKSRLSVGVDAAAPASVSNLEELEKQNSQAAGNLEGPKWESQRKAMRYEQHKTKSGQSY